MGDDRHSGLRIASAAAALACLVSAPNAPAQPLRGYLQVQYQNLESRSAVDRSLDRQWWGEVIQLDYAKLLRPTLNLTAQAYFNNVDYTGGAEGSQVPYGSLRLSHPNAGLFGTYRLTDQTDVLGGTSRQKAATLGAYLAPRSGPRLDANWIRRRLEPMERLPGSTATTRTAALSYGIRALSLRGGYTDLVQDPDDPARREITQRTWNAGGSYATGWRTASLSLIYDYTGNHRGAGDGATEDALVHSANVLGGKRFSRQMDLGLTYSFRHTRTQNQLDQSFNDNDGSLMLSYIPSPPFHLSTGGGVRTVRSGPSQDTEEYLLASASAQGRLRTDWTGAANATYSINWPPEGGPPRAANSYGASTQMRLWRGLTADAGGQVSVNRRTPAAQDSVVGVAPGNISTQTNTGFTAQPLRSFSFGYAYQLYRVGESLTGPASSANTGTLNVGWTPVRQLRLDGNRTRTKSYGPSAPRLSTARVNLQWNPSTALQISSSYARSDVPRLDPNVTFVPGQEIVNVRILAALARDLRGNFGVSWLDPGKSRSVRQVDATITQRFGG